MAIAVGEVNGAPGLDLATADEGDTISLLANRGDGVFAPLAGLTIAGRYNASDMTSGRFNADSISDFAVSADDIESATFAGSALLYRSNATMQFAVTPVTVGLFPTCIVRADLTGDGIDDVAVCGTAASGGGLISILRGRADFSFTPPVSVPLGAIAPSRLAVQDVDRDGRPDMVIVDGDGNSIWIAYGGPEPSFEAAILVASSNMPSSVVIADVGDPLPAIAVTSRADNTVEIYRQTQTRAFAPKASYSVGLSPVALAAADVDGDGKVDFLTANRAAGTVTVLLGGQAGALLLGETVEVGRGPVALAVADFNGDQKLDFATADQDDESFGADRQSVSVVLNGMSPPFTPTASPTATSTSASTPPPTVTATANGTQSRTPSPTRTATGSPRPTVTPAGPWDANCDGRLDQGDIDAVIAQVFDPQSGCLSGEVTAADITATVDAVSTGW